MQCSSQRRKRNDSVVHVWQVARVSVSVSLRFDIACYIHIVSRVRFVVFCELGLGPTHPIQLCGSLNYCLSLAFIRCTSGYLLSSWLRFPVCCAWQRRQRWFSPVTASAVGSSAFARFFSRQFICRLNKEISDCHQRSPCGLPKEIRELVDFLFPCCRSLRAGLFCTWLKLTRRLTRQSANHRPQFHG